MKIEYQIIIYTVCLIVLLILFFNSKLGLYIIKKSKINKILGENIEDEKYVLKKLKIVVNGKKCTIDYVLINKKGIFVINPMCMNGKIKGDDESTTFIHTIGKKSKEIKNPIKENEINLLRIQTIVGNDVKIYNCTVFIKGNIKDVDSEFVYTKKEFKKLINDNETVLSTKEINKYYFLLTNKKREEKIVIDDSLVCPECGGKLIYKVSNKGNYYGCSNFPKCEYKRKAR